MKIFKGRVATIPLSALVLTLTSCAMLQREVSRPTSFADDGGASAGRVSQAELQDDLLRFESQFNARIESASQPLEASADPLVRYRAAMNRLIYSSNSLGVALGPSPESNLLDMVAFIQLSHAVLREYWIPTQFGTAGEPLDQAFTESEQQIWQIAGKVMTESQRVLLQKVISEWREKHSEQINVETVRLSAFSSEAGAKAAGLEQNVGGLFASVQQSTQAVDAARLFAERALYYAERAPFLFRLQARLGASEIFDDAGLNLSRLSVPKELQQTLLAARATLDDANSTLKSLTTLMKKLSDRPVATESARAIVTQLADLLREWNRLLSSASGQKGMSQMAGVADQLNQQSNRFIEKLAWLGAALIAFFWMMYALSKLAIHYVLSKSFREIGPAERQKEDGKKAA
jgi:hypothetical protein